MDAMTQMATALSAIPQTPGERRAAKNRRYYAKVREMHQWRWKLRRLAEMAALFPAEHEVIYAY